MIKEHLDNICQSIDYFSENGFKMIDLEWVVPEHISDITKPKERNNFYFKDKVFVASGEQTFINMMLNGSLEPNEYYMGLTPCFRDEEVIDETHKMYFMKLELFYYCDFTPPILYSLPMMLGSYAEENFKNLGVNCNIVDVNKKDNGIDIFSFDLNGEKSDIELGSYGLRKLISNNKDYYWSYGTGIAEPRFSYIKNMEKSI